MSDVTSHPQGAFCWPELATTDQKSAVSFYQSLLGWGLNDIPMGPDASYSMFTVRSGEVAAASTQQPDERTMGVPPHWNNYVSVKSADDTVKKAQELGGGVLAPAFDVMDVGRMAVLQDPTGAVFCIWEAKKHIGAKVINEPGALCWTELTTSDTKAAEKFYTGLFGWTPKHSSPGAPMEYTEFSINGVPSIGMMAKPKEMPAHIPSYWMPYFQVSGVDASTAKAKDLGAHVMVGPQDIPNTGRFTIASDPQGAVFALFEFKK